MEFVLPKMSWEQPIEEEILEFAKHMRSSMCRQESRFTPDFFGIFGNGQSEKLAGYIDAYDTIIKHVENEIALRKEIAGATTQDNHDEEQTK